MRWKLLRRRLTISAPRMSVRSAMPWPLRAAGAAIVLGFCAAIGLWAFELGKDLAGVDGGNGNACPGHLDAAQLVNREHPDDKIVIEMVRFPSHSRDGEGVIVEVLLFAMGIVLQASVPGSSRGDHSNSGRGGRWVARLHAQ